MKRNNTMLNSIKRVYDEMVKKNYFSFKGNLKRGIFIDPTIGSAQAQRINSFIYGYAIRMLLLHEYAHIINNDMENL